MKNNVCKILIFSIISLAVGFSLGYFAKPTQIVNAKSLRENTDKYKFIHPLLAVNRATEDPSPQYTGLLKSIGDFINTEKKSLLTDDASVYFIDYGKNSGTFAFNADEKYSPASLIKVVIMMSYLKQSEADPKILNKTFEYSPDMVKDLDLIPAEAPSDLVVGKSYSVNDLINKMIVDSDNGARNLLWDNINKDYFDDIYTNLGYDLPEKSPNYTISPKDYSLFLRVLYNSTYLSEENSEKALSILSQATFTDGLMAGLPAGTIVAHKYGEYANGSDYKIDSVELHDCGIIYLPNNPYLLCVMTRGKDLKNLETIIATISKMIYEQVK